MLGSGDLSDRAGLGLREALGGLEPDALFVPTGIVSQVGEGDSCQFLDDLVLGDRGAQRAGFLGLGDFAGNLNITSQAAALDFSRFLAVAGAYC